MTLNEALNNITARHMILEKIYKSECDEDGNHYEGLSFKEWCIKQRDK